METSYDTLLSIIQLQQLYINSLINIKNKEFFLASEQLEEAYTLFDNVIEHITVTSPIRDYAIQLRDLIIDHLKQINQYIYDKEDIVDPLDSDSTIQLDHGYETTGYNTPNIPETEDTPIDYYHYLQLAVNQYFPCCLKYKLKID